MGFKKQEKFKRFEQQDVEGFNTALDAALDTLEQEGLSNNNTEPETVMVMRNSKKGPDGERLVEVIVYNGATIEDITKDLNSRK